MKIYGKPKIEVTVLSLNNVVAASAVPTLTYGGEEGRALSESYASMFNGQ